MRFLILVIVTFLIVPIGKRFTQVLLAVRQVAIGVDRCSRRCMVLTIL